MICAWPSKKPPMMALARSPAGTVRPFTPASRISSLLSPAARMQMYLGARSSVRAVHEHLLSEVE